VGAQCRTAFPVVDGTPVLLNEASSVFAIEDFTQRSDTFFRYHESPLRRALNRVLPSPSLDMVSARNFTQFAQLCCAGNPAPRVLVVGGSILGKGIEPLLRSPIQLFETDVAFGQRTMLICDAHDLPFADGTFDGVVIQAVLGHVVDPARCVAEIHRVLRPAGLVYAESAFMQQVCGGPYDFYRFTQLGHRRLFRRFEEVASGPARGPGTALGWSYRYLLMSLARTRRARSLLEDVARLTSFPVKYLDYLLMDHPAATDAASGFYFLGRRSTEVLRDRDLLKQYRGMV
jgi:SAM-dependent methyltransferase